MRLAPAQGCKRMEEERLLASSPTTCTHKQEQHNLAIYVEMMKTNDCFSISPIAFSLFGLFHIYLNRFSMTVIKVALSKAYLIYGLLLRFLDE